MCGIAGIFNLGADEPVTVSALESMIATMPYRGPDARGTSVPRPGTGLGHLRLAILDLVPESNQPFEIDDGAYVITFNGEIFNYVELREELEGLGHRFRTRSDTEVLVRAYAAWGEAAVPRLNGMWSFAIYDRDRDELFCSRDRFGIKPFHYAEHAGRFLFSSEVKGILAVAPDLARPNYRALSLQLRYSVSASLEETCFEGVRRLPPAHNLVVRRGGIERKRYWDYPTDPREDVTPEDAAEEFRALLVDALRLRMRSDVPVGATLSGGLDSSAIVCLLRTFHEGPFDTFTAAYGGGWFDESEEARALAESLGMKAHLLPALDHDFLPTLRTIIRHLETPVAHPAVFPLWNVMEQASRTVTVLLEGQGADELLAGYPFHFPYAVADDLRRGNLVGAAFTTGRRVRDIGPLSTFLWFARIAAPWLHGAFRRLRGDERVLRRPLREWASDRPPQRDAPPMPGCLNRHLRTQHEVTLVDLLQYGDAISMAHSLESRLPFTDYRLVELAFRLPGRLKYRDGRSKVVLRDAVQRDVPPAIVASRRKLGFPTPVERWFREKPDVTVDPVLRGARCRERGLFDAQAVADALDAHRAGKADRSYSIYRWLITELWFQELIDAT